IGTGTIHDLTTFVTGTEQFHLLWSCGQSQSEATNANVGPCHMHGIMHGEAVMERFRQRWDRYKAEDVSEEVLILSSEDIWSTASEITAASAYIEQMDPQVAVEVPTDPVPQYDVSNENISSARYQLNKLLGHQQVVSKLDARRAHSITKWSSAAPSQIPALVVFPQSTTEVADIMKVCLYHRIPVVGYSGGTSLPGAITATQTGVCIDFNCMNKILAIHAEDMDVVVQPAVGWEELNAHLAAHNLFFPPDPGPGAKIGGMVSSVYVRSIK
ncbi:MAG: hypothetical protein Q9214_006868, partial [Letrouitia sp. 1 TL-2023]